MIDPLETITDWKGKEVQVGDTVVVVRTQPIFGKHQFGFLDLKTGKYEVVSEYEPPKYCWDVLWEFEVLDGHRVEFGEETTWNLPLNLAIMGQPSDIVCIKGESDNEEEYFKDYFSHIDVAQ